MLLQRVLHIRDAVRLADGTCRALPVFPAPAFGVRVWAGRLSAMAAGKEGESIVASDYVTRETVNFCAWAHVWGYFRGRDYAPLAQQVREIVEHNPGSH